MEGANNEGRIARLEADVAEVKKLSANSIEVARLAADVVEVKRLAVPQILFDERDRRVQESMLGIKEDIREMKDAQRASRSLITGALLTAFSSIIVQLVLFFLLKAK